MQVSLEINVYILVCYVELVYIWCILIHTQVPMMKNIYSNVCKIMVSYAPSDFRLMSLHHVVVMSLCSALTPGRVVDVLHQLMGILIK